MSLLGRFWSKIEKQNMGAKSKYRVCPFPFSLPSSGPFEKTKSPKFPLAPMGVLAPGSAHAGHLVLCSPSSCSDKNFNF